MVRNLYFSFLVTPSFTKEDDPVSVRIYSNESRKMPYFAYNHSKNVWAKIPKQTPSSLNYINYSHEYPKDFFSIKSAKQ